MKNIIIEGKHIEAGSPNYIIAEIGFNHEGDMSLAAKMIERAAEAGADAVKFQTFKAAELVLEDTDHFDMIKRMELSLNDHKELKQVARQNGVTFLSTPFCEEAVDLLEEIDVPAFKIASMDLTNLPFLRRIASIGKPVILSTGMAVLSEIAEAVEAIRATGNDQIALLHCISKYPALPEDVNLENIKFLEKVFSLPVGYSDHVEGNTIACAAVAIGAVLIEKHFTIDKSLPGPDHKISMDVCDLKNLVKDIRLLEKSLGNNIISYERSDRENNTMFRRGLYARCDIDVGTTITSEMIKSVRPEKGLPAKFLDTIIGKKATRSIPKDCAINLEVI